MSVIAKFKVKSLTKSKYGDKPLHTVAMEPVWSNGNPEHENSKFWEATPIGVIQLGCINAEAAAQFDLDEEIYVEFRRAPKS